MVRPRRSGQGRVWGASRQGRRQPPNNLQWLNAEIALGIILALFPFGWEMLRLPHNPILGIACWLICLALFGHIIWFRLAWHWGWRASISVTVISSFAFAVWIALHKPKESNAIMRFVDQELALDFPIKAGQKGGVNFYPKLLGSTSAQDEHFYCAMGFMRRDVSEAAMRHDIDDLFRQLYNRVNNVTRDGSK